MYKNIRVLKKVLNDKSQEFQFYVSTIERFAVFYFEIITRIIKMYID